MKSLTDSQKVGPRFSRVEIGVALLIAAVLELIQSQILPSFLQPKWSLVFVVYIGWYSSAIKAAFCSTVFGLLEDFLMGLFFGLNGLSRTILGYFVSWLSRWVATEGGYIRALCIAGLSLCETLIIFLLLSLLTSRIPQFIWWEELLKSIVTGVVGEFVFRFYDASRVPPADFRKI